MALYYSAPNCICSSSPPTPAKTLISNSSSSLILRTPCIILYPFLPKTSIATKPFKLNFPLWAQRPPHKYTYPDPIPEFAQAETQKFRDDLLEKLLGDKETFGDDLDTVIDVCTQENKFSFWCCIYQHKDMWVHLSVIYLRKCFNQSIISYMNCKDTLRIASTLISFLVVLLKTLVGRLSLMLQRLQWN